MKERGKKDRMKHKKKSKPVVTSRMRLRDPPFWVKSWRMCLPFVFPLFHTCMRPWMIGEYVARVPAVAVCFLLAILNFAYRFIMK